MIIIYESWRLTPLPGSMWGLSMAIVMQLRKMMTSTMWSNILWVMILLHRIRNLKQKTKHRVFKLQSQQVSAYSSSLWELLHTGINFIRDTLLSSDLCKVPDVALVKFIANTVKGQCSWFVPSGTFGCFLLHIWAFGKCSKEKLPCYCFIF